ncbi:hypothetical protein P0Y35_00815 [Kiritimatiellaeota bacterium B1221]|nr:hypothetical protein [Kiritimatiellaeota bacterium B1221]
MQFLDRLEQKWGKFTFPYLLITLLAGQVLFYFGIRSGNISPDLLKLNASQFLTGDFWRIFSFMLDPMPNSPLFFAFFIYITYLTGSKLEWHWGEFRFNVYLGMCWIFTVLFSFLTPGASFSNFHIFLGLGMAFAKVFPDFTFMIFFVLPVRAQYLGILAGAGFVLTIVSAPLPMKLEALGSLLPFVLFFWKDFMGMSQQKKKAKAFRRKARVLEGVPFHTCETCKRTDKSDPEMAFRYENGVCICEDCLEKRKGS